tara:strand:- start:11966 stop:14176 length:2211 start_codon:yes stop_codon:yes gene_type:complete
MLEEVVVTAQKRSQSVNDISISANAFAGEQLNELGIDSAVDLGAHTPGLVTVNATSGGTPIFAIRGIGLDDFTANNTSGVGVYTDEVFASSPVYLGGQLFDIKRVEVLKGPQGTLYGKNTTGGAINFISNKPSDEFEAYAELGYGSLETVEITAAVSGPLSDSVRGRIATQYVKAGEGWQKDVVTGKEYGKEDNLALRGQLAIDLGENGSANIKAYYSKDDSTPESPHAEANERDLGPGFEALNTRHLSADKVSVGVLDLSRDEEGSGLALTINYDLNGVELVSISAWDQYERQVVDNYDGSPAATLDLLQDNKLKQWSQELRLVSTADNGFSWVLGANISYEEIDGTDIFDDSFMVTDSVFFGSFDPADITAQELDQFVSDYVQETDSYGVYAHTETELNNSLSLTVGLRYSYDERSFEGTTTEMFFGFPIPVTTMNQTEDEDAVTGKVGLDWQASDNLLVYTSVATAYKSGTFFAGPVIDSDSWSYVDPEEVLAYELGFKWTLLEGSMQLNGAAFQLEYKDRQSLVAFISDDFSAISGFEVTDVTLINVPESETKGFELDLNWAPADGLLLQAGVAYLDSEVTKGPGSSELRGIAADNSVNDSANQNGSGWVDALSVAIDKGTVLSQAPEWSYNVLAAYEFAIANDLVMRVQSSYSWVDDQVAALSDPDAHYGPTSNLNAQVSIGAEDGKWKVIAWGRNLEDNDSETYAFNGISGRTSYRQQPSTYGLTFRYEI